MEIKSHRFFMVDILYILLMILPIAFGIILKILTKVPADGIVITGAQIFFTISLPFRDLPITESQINSCIVMVSVLGLCLYMTHGLSVKVKSGRQLLVEWIVENTEIMVIRNMGKYFSGFSPFITAILALSAFSSLITLFGLYPPTSDINIVAGWAILVFALITYYKFKCGPLSYIKSFGDPVPFLAPLNVISEIATPVSMAFRYYGNVLSGVVISVLVASGLQWLSFVAFAWLPATLDKIPFLQIGIPAILSLYFDLFSGCLQAYIFAMLTMLYISNGFRTEEYEKRKLKKNKNSINWR